MMMMRDANPENENIIEDIDPAQDYEKLVGDDPDGP